jgi:hypothetical protein
MNMTNLARFYPTRSRTRSAIVLVVVALLALAFPTGATAGGVQSSRSYVVKGLQGPPVTECDGKGSEATYVMLGDLVGCWYTDAFVPGEMHPGGEFTATGTETFAGCIDANHNGACNATDPTGTFRTTFVFYAILDPNTGAELSGHCYHPIIAGSGTGGFARAHGAVNFVDNVTPTQITADYFGEIELASR